MVFEIAKEFLPIQVEPSRTVEIVVEAPDTTTPATWSKDQVKIVPDDTKYEMVTKERKRSLVVHDVKPEDAGEYVCQVGPHRTTAKVEVLKPTEKEIKGSLLLHLCRIRHGYLFPLILPHAYNLYERYVCNLNFKKSTNPFPLVYYPIVSFVHEILLLKYRL